MAKQESITRWLVRVGIDLDDLPSPPSRVAFVASRGGYVAIAGRDVDVSLVLDNDADLLLVWSIVSSELQRRGISLPE